MAPASDDDDADELEPDDSASADLYEVSLSLDAILYLLADHHRRDLLRYLVESPGETCSFDECTDHLVTRGAERAEERPARVRVEARLRHVHVPRLADADVLEYDSRSQEIRYRGHDRLEFWLDRIHADEGASD